MSCSEQFKSTHLVMLLMGYSPSFITAGIAQGRPLSVGQCAFSQFLSRRYCTGWPNRLVWAGVL